MFTEEKKRQFQREWIARRRRDYFSDKSCAECGAKEDLELTSKDLSSKVSHGLWSWSEERRLAELAKAKVICKKCRILNYQLRNRKHGLSGYRNWRCRCEVCTAAFKRYHINQKERALYPETFAQENSNK